MPRITVTFGSLASGPRVTQYGRPATCTLLDSSEMGQPQNYGRPHGWDDATVPRTALPVRFSMLNAVREVRHAELPLATLRYIRGRRTHIYR